MDAHTKIGRQLTEVEDEGGALQGADFDELYAWHLAQHPHLVAKLIVE